MMTKNNSTTYSIVGSMGIHVLFTLGAGSFLMNINNNLQPQKTYQMEFVKRKVPPPVKKETIRKEPVLREIKVASLTPKAMPVLQPKVSVRQTSRQIRKARAIIKTSIATPKQVKRSVTTKSLVMRSSKPATTKRIPVARSFISSSKTFSSKSAQVSMVQGTPKFKLGKIPQKVVRSGNSSSTGNKKGRVMPVQTGIKLASLTSLPSARGVPNIVDEGALKSYIGQVRRSVLGAKRYPEASRRAGRQGKLQVQFTILKNGEVGNVRLLSETPYPNLNREAMAAVKRAAPFSGIPDSIMQQSLKVVLPFRFELN